MNEINDARMLQIIWKPDTKIRSWIPITFFVYEKYDNFMQVIYFLHFDILKWQFVTPKLPQK